MLIPLSAASQQTATAKLCYILLYFFFQFKKKQHFGTHFSRPARMRYYTLGDPGRRLTQAKHHNGGWQSMHDKLTVQTHCREDQHWCCCRGLAWMLNSMTGPVLPIPIAPPISTTSNRGMTSGYRLTNKATFVSAPVHMTRTFCSLPLPKQEEK